MFWKPSDQNLKELYLRELCEITLREREKAWMYRDGVVEEAIRRASGAKSQKAIIDAVESAFIDYELGRRQVVANG
jgi:hypothetical protein